MEGGAADATSSAEMCADHDVVDAGAKDAEDDAAGINVWGLDADAATDPLIPHSCHPWTACAPAAVIAALGLAALAAAPEPSEAVAGVVLWFFFVHMSHWFCTPRSVRRDYYNTFKCELFAIVIASAQGKTRKALLRAREVERGELGTLLALGKLKIHDVVRAHPLTYEETAKHFVGVPTVAALVLRDAVSTLDLRFVLQVVLQEEVDGGSAGVPASLLGAIIGAAVAHAAPVSSASPLTSDAAKNAAYATSIRSACATCADVISAMVHRTSSGERGVPINVEQQLCAPALVRAIVDLVKSSDDPKKPRRLAVLDLVVNYLVCARGPGSRNAAAKAAVALPMVRCPCERRAHRAPAMRLVFSPSALYLCIPNL